MFLKTFLLASVGFPLFMGGIAALLFSRKQICSKTSGLLFHSVLPGSIQPNLSCLSQRRFSKIIDYLKHRRYSSITIKEAALTNDQLQSQIMITFDDGFQSIYDYALPVLDNAGFKATIFCVTDFIGKSSSWDVYGQSRHLDNNSIYNLSKMGHEIGSHTCTHANLPYLSDKDLIRELRDSKSKLEDITGKEVKSISFPHGSWDKRVWKKVCEAGYTSASTYRNHVFSENFRLFPVYGVYQFDSPDSVFRRIKQNEHSFSLSYAISSLMPHFAKGTPVWKFRKNYQIFPD